MKNVISKLFLGLTLLFALTACSDLEADADGTSADGKKYDLGMNVDEFEKRFNEVSEELGSDIKADVKLDEGEKLSSFTLAPNDSVRIVGTIYNDTKMVKEVKLVGYGFANEDEELGYMTSAGILMSTLDPKLDAESRGDIFLTRLEYEKAMNSMDSNKITADNGIRYSLNASEDNGIWFIISNNKSYEKKD